MKSVIEYILRNIKDNRVKIFNGAAGTMAVVLLGSSTMVDGPLQGAAIVIGLINGLMWFKTR